jgi:uncharacterized protein YkwD
VTTTLKHLFTPHYTNNHRAALLKPAGLSVLVGIFLLSQAFISLLKAAPALPSGFVLGYASNISPDEVVMLTNTKRAEQGLAPLTVSGALTQAAIAKANHMFMHDYWAHIAPDGTTPWTFIRNAGYRYSVAGENLARDFGDSGSMVQAWMDSPTHRDNIVNSKYTEIGIAVVDGKLQGTETTLVVQMFGLPSGAVAQVTAPTQAPQSQAAAPAPIATSIPVALPTSVPELATLETEAEAIAAEPGLSVPEELTLTRITRAEVAGPYDAMLSPLTLTKSVSVSLIAVLLMVLGYDLWALKQHRLPRGVGKNWAHLTFYSIILVIIVAMQQGKVL